MDAARDATLSPDGLLRVQRVVSALALPTSGTSDALGFDLDGTNDASDNKLGDFFGFGEGFGFAGQPQIDAGIASGTTLAGGPAPSAIFLSAPGVDPVRLQLIGTHIEANLGSDTGRWGGAITEADVRSVFVPWIALIMTNALQTSCFCFDGGPPTCGEGSGGALIDQNYNANHDCMISGDELFANPLIQATLASDVDMFNGASFGPGLDGTADSLSVGVGLTFAPATW